MNYEEWENRYQLRKAEARGRHIYADIYEPNMAELPGCLLWWFGLTIGIMVVSALCDWIGAQKTLYLLILLSIFLVPAWARQRIEREVKQEVKRALNEAKEAYDQKEILGIERAFKDS